MAAERNEIDALLTENRKFPPPPEFAKNAHVSNTSLHAKWFTGGQINVPVNCVDRHIETSRRNKAARIWEGEPGDRRTLTYWDLYREVNAFANVLKSLGVTRGDRVALYLPL